MYTIKSFMPGNFKESIVFILIMMVFFIVPVGYLSYMNHEIDKLNKKQAELQAYSSKFFADNPGMEKVVIQLDSCMTLNNGKYRVNDSCIDKFEEETTKEQKQKLVDYLNKKLELFKDKK